MEDEQIDPLSQADDFFLHIDGDNRTQDSLVPSASGPSLGYTGSFARKVLSVINGFFFLVGIAVAIYGVVTLEAPSIFDNGSSLLSGKTALIIIIAGGSITGVAMLGLCAVKGEVRCLTKIYIGVLCLILLIQAVLTILVATDVFGIDKLVTISWEVANQNTLRDVQNTLNCCGLNQYNDSYAALPCPARITTTSSLFNTNQTTLEGVACLDLLVDGFWDSYDVVAWIWLSVAVVQVFSLCLSGIFLKQLTRKQEDSKMAPLLLASFDT